MVFKYRLVAERSDYLEIHAVGAKSILGIVVLVLGLVLSVVGAGLLSSANMKIAGGALLATAGVALGAGICLTITGLIKKNKIIVDRQGGFIELSGSKIPFDEIGAIELHAISRSRRDMDGNIYFERLWLASLLMKKEIPLTKKIPSFMLKDWAAHKWGKGSVPLFQASEITEKPVAADISGRPSAPEFYDLIGKIASISGLKLEDKTADDLAKESASVTAAIISPH